MGRSVKVFEIINYGSLLASEITPEPLKNKETLTLVGRKLPTGSLKSFQERKQIDLNVKENLRNVKNDSKNIFSSCNR